MKYLLDTHVFLWWLKDPLLMADRARVAIANPKNFIFVSAVCFIEIAIKEKQGKLKSEGEPGAEMARCRFQELPLTFLHASAMRSLPVIHKDPFHRMLVAQALTERMTLVSRDEALADYPVSLLAA